MKDWGGPNDYIFLSIGKNDIYKKYLPDDNIHDNYKAFLLTTQKKKEADTMFKKFVEIVNKINEKFPTAKIILTTLYYPHNIDYRKFHNIIEYWNKNIIDFSKTHKNKVYGVLRLDKIITNPSEITHLTEVSGNGSKKLVEEMKKLLF